MQAGWPAMSMLGFMFGTIDGTKVRNLLLYPIRKERDRAVPFRTRRRRPPRVRSRRPPSTGPSCVAFRRWDRGQIELLCHPIRQGADPVREHGVGVFSDVTGFVA